MITNMNQRNKMVIQGVVYKVKCLNYTSVYIGEIGTKLKARLKKHKQDVSKDDKSKICGLPSYIKNTGRMIDWEKTKIMYREKICVRLKLRDCVNIRLCKYNILND